MTIRPFRILHLTNHRFKHHIYQQSPYCIYLSEGNRSLWGIDADQEIIMDSLLIAQTNPRTDVGKRKIWDRLRRRNSSSPILPRIDPQNWSTRSLPRLGSFGSSSQLASARSSPKLSLECSPVLSAFNISETLFEHKPKIVKNFFSTLPSEVKLRIFGYLPIKSIARASIVFLTCPLC